MKYQAQKPYRIRYGFFSVSVDRPVPKNVSLDESYWWVEFNDGKKAKWMQSKNWYGEKKMNSDVRVACTSCHRIRSIRAFRKKLREWSEYLPIGTKVKLESRWTGYNVVATIKKIKPKKRFDKISNKTIIVK